MHQLNGMDAMFIHQESERAPMHISPLMIYAPHSATDEPLSYAKMLALFQSNLHKSPVFRRKLIKVPLNLDQPYWVEDPEFNLEFHVRHIALPRPGDWHQLCTMVARLHSRGLDMTRPLWEAYIIEGLDNVAGMPKGSFALLLKVHHAAIDGVSGAEIITAIHSLAPNEEPDARGDDWEPEPNPPLWKLLSRSYVNSWRTPVRMLGTASQIAPRFFRASQNANRQAKGEHKIIHTRFNGRVSNYRVADAVCMDLADIKSIKNAVAGATINDVMVSIIGGALRAYLIDKDELPATSLTAAAPISVRSDNEKDSAGNRVSVMMMPLGTDIANAKKRLAAVHAGAIESKAYSSALGADILSDITSGLSPQIASLGVRAAGMLAMMPNKVNPANVIISNVPGPQMPLYLGSARLHTLLGLGPVMDNIGLFHAVMSYNGAMSITFVCCREMLPDPEFYARCLEKSLHDLKRAVSKPKRRKKAASA
jgi:WS/DGAT/MGAT family acyltransferase